MVGTIRRKLNQPAAPRFAPRARTVGIWSRILASRQKNSFRSRRLKRAGARTIAPVGRNKLESSEKSLKDVHALEGWSPGLPAEGETGDGTTNNHAELWSLHGRMSARWLCIEMGGYLNT